MNKKNWRPCRIQIFLSSVKSHFNNFEIECNGPNKNVHVDSGECMYIVLSGGKGTF